MVATAQAELKVATVNVTELYTPFHKRFDTEVRLKDEEAKIKAEIKVREDKLRALQEEDQKIQKKYDPSLSSAQVKKLTEQHNIKMNEIQAAQQELQTYVQRRSLAFKELFRRGICHYCGEHFAQEDLTIDHIVPVARGGRSTRGNMVVCCRSCNQSKSCLTPAEQLLNMLEEQTPEA
jgi:5-methylcytosine-specific restriction endonuclease McrA